MIVRLWPHETKGWGRAFAAELPEIQNFSESVRWLIGGTLLLTRERFCAFLKSFGRPFGVPVDGPLETVVKSSMGAPRTPRIATLIFLAASVAILLQPEVRMSLVGMFSLHSGDDWNSSKWRSVHKLEREAARTGDPKLFAILSLVSAHDTDETQEESLARQAIAKDISFTWLDYQHFASSQVERLQKWDPDNAVVRLIPAESLFEKIQAASRDTGGFVHQKSHELTSLEKDAAANTDWLAAMDYAFSAPNYDTYTLRQLQLLRDVTRSYGINDPDIAVRILLAQRVPNFMNLITYTHVVLHRAAEAEKKGDIAAAVAGPSKILHFAQNMQLHGPSSIEELIAVSLSRQACESLQPVLARAGRTEEAALTGFELAQGQAVIERMKSRRRTRDGLPVALAWTALFMHAAAFTIVVLVAVFIASMTILSLRNRVAVESRGWLLKLSSLTVELAPLLLLFAATTLFFAYHPYAQVYRSYLERPDSLLSAEAMENFLSAAFVVHVVPETIAEPQGTYLLWLSATVVLSMVAILLIYRMRPRHRTV